MVKLRVALPLAASLVAGAAVAQDRPPPAAPAPLRIAAAPGKPVGFLVRVECTSEARTGTTSAGAPRRSHHELSVALETGAEDASGSLPVKLRVERVAGRSTRLGKNSFDFDSEAAPPEDDFHRTSYYSFTALAGAELTFGVRPDGSVTSVGGVENARRLALGRAGGNSLLALELKSQLTDESAAGLLKSLLGPAPFPGTPLSTKSAWTDVDSLAFNSWDSSYEISREVRPTSMTATAVRLVGKGTAKLVESKDIAMLPLRLSSGVRASAASDWTISAADGLPLTGTETISLEGSAGGGKETLSAKHKMTFRVTRLAAPPPPAVRPLTGSKDTEALQAKDREREEASRAEKRAARAEEGTRGAWCVSDDGALVAAGTPACDVEVWASGGKRPVVVLKGHTDLIHAIAFTDGGKSLYACSDDGTVRGWQIEDGKQIASLGKPYETFEVGGTRVSAGYRGVASSPDGRYTAFVRTGMSVWDSRKRGYLDPEPSFLFPHMLGFAADSRHLAVAGFDSVGVFDLEAAPTRRQSTLRKGEENVTLEPVWKRGKPMFSFGKEPQDDWPEGHLRDVAVLDGPGIVVTLHRDLLAEKAKSLLSAWDLSTGKRRWGVPTDANSLLSARKASSILLRGAAGIRIVSPSDGKVLRTVPLPAKPRVARIVSPDGAAWFDADRDGNLIRVEIGTAPAPGGGVK